jgi:hypothetical protein
VTGVCAGALGFPRLAQETKGCNLMNVTIGLDQIEDVFNCDVSDEALEVAGVAGKEISVRYTLQFCTNTDCALLS